MNSRIAVFLALALLAGSCSATTPTTSYGGRATASPLPSKTGHQPGGTSKPGSTDSGSARPADPGQPSGGSNDHPFYEDEEGVGAMALPYLRSSQARSLVVEVDYVDGFKPSQDALDHLKTVLSRELSKPAGIKILVDDKIPNERSAYTFDQLDGLEARFRGHRSGGSVATMWLAYLNGDLAGNSGTLGVAFRASEAVIFKEQIEAAASALVDEASIERSVTTHEIGHLLGLVNIGYTSRHDHEDPDHPHHSSHKSSVMYWAIEDISISTILRGGPPSDFDSDDRDDLAQLRG